MARMRISPDWKNSMHELIDKYHREGVIPDPQVFTWNVSCQWYIRQLLETNVPYRLIQRGAGVKEVRIEANKCEHCNGRGYI